MNEKTINHSSKLPKTNKLFSRSAQVAGLHQFHICEDMKHFYLTEANLRLQASPTHDAESNSPGRVRVLSRNATFQDSLELYPNRKSTLELPLINAPDRPLEDDFIDDDNVDNENVRVYCPMPLLRVNNCHHQKLQKVKNFCIEFSA